MFNIIVAVDRANGIGIADALPWRISADMQYFKRITTRTQSSLKQNAVIMGRKTWGSLPSAYRPLKDRINIVLTKNSINLISGATLAHNFDDALNIATTSDQKDKIESVFIIGGASVYQQAIHHPECQKLYITRVDGIFDCDTFFPHFDDQFKLIETSSNYTENAISFRFETYERIGS